MICVETESDTAFYFHSMKNINQLSFDLANWLVTGAAGIEKEEHPPSSFIASASLNLRSH